MSAKQQARVAAPELLAAAEAGEAYMHGIARHINADGKFDRSPTGFVITGEELDQLQLKWFELNTAALAKARGAP